METTRKTNLQAFIEAQETGQIAITKRTARILEHMTRLDDVVSTLCDDFAEGYSGEAQDEISDRICNSYAQLNKTVFEEFANYLAMFPFLCSTDFNGL